MKRAYTIFSTSLVILICWTLGSAQSRTHDLKLLPENIHWGYYDARLKPVLQIASGDTIRVETMVARGLERLRLAGAKEEEIPEALKVIEGAVKDRGPGAHPMTGPIFVEDAQPGDTLEVRILSFEFLHSYGVTGFLPGGGTLPEEFPDGGLKLIRFNEKTGTAEFGPGLTLELAPFLVPSVPRRSSGRSSESLSGLQRVTGISRSGTQTKSPLRHSGAAGFRQF